MSAATCTRACCMRRGNSVRTRTERIGAKGRGSGRIARAAFVHVQQISRARARSFEDESSSR